MKRAAQIGQQLDVVGGSGQTVDRGFAVANHLTGFFQEDVLEVGVFNVFERLALGKCRRRGQLTDLFQGLRQSVLIIRSGRLRCLLGTGCQLRLVGQCGLTGQLFELLLGHGAGAADQLKHSTLRGWLFLGICNFRGRFAAHDHAQLIRFCVKNEQLFGECVLVVQHVHEQAENAHAVAQRLDLIRARNIGSIKALRLPILGFGNIPIHHMAHVIHGLRALRDTQNGQHTTHLDQQAWHTGQFGGIGWVAEKLVQMTFHLVEVGTQLAHHGAHGLAIAHAAIKLFHPRGNWLGVSTIAHGLQASRQFVRAIQQTWVIQIEIIERGFHEQHGRRHFHGQFGIGRRAGLCGHVLDRTHLGHQACGGRIQIGQAVGHQTELIAGRASALHFARGESGPCFFQRLNALACQDKQGRIELAKPGFGIVDRRGVGQAIGLAHRCQHGHVCRWAGLQAKEQQVMGKPL